MKKFFPAAAFAVLLLLSVLSGTAHAISDGDILEVYCEEQTITAFLGAGLDTAQLSCMVSNQEATVTAAGTLSDGNALIKTTILLDISTSMPSALRETILDAVERLIEYKPDHEAYQLVLFGDEISVLQDFSYDRYDLSEAAEGITFDGQASRVYDAVYNTIPPLASESGAPVFYRTIVITDGVDDTATGITKEELYLALQDQRYPVDVIAVGATGENRDLSAIARISGGSYQPLGDGTDTAALAQSLSVGTYAYFTAEVPESLLDGSTRQVDVSDGANSVSIDVKFPVFGTPAADTPASPEGEPPADAEPPEPDPSPSLLERYGVYLLCGGGAIVLLVIILLIASSARRKKKKQTPPPPPADLVPPRTAAAATEFFRDDGSDGTQYTIQLSDISRPDRIWTLPVRGEVLIGRAEHCPVRLDDRSVSREHCKITPSESGLTLIHLSTTNQTALNGTRVTDAAPLQSGDTLKIGREQLHVDYIQALGAPVRQAQPQAADGKKTESIFDRS